jgi:parallel beta-helix repeat protein
LSTFFSSGSVFEIRLAKASSGTIYIGADGSIDPPTALIQRDGDLYTLIGNITSDSDGIVIQRNNMTLDGAGYTIQGSMSSNEGVELAGRTNITIRKTNIRNFDRGISLDASFGNYVIGNNITANNIGVRAWSNNNNTISGNNITSNDYAIWLMGSDNEVLDNYVADSGMGIEIEYGGNNTASGNRLVNSGFLVKLSFGNSIKDNLVNGKPLVYLEGISDTKVQGEVGQLILNNCNNVTVEALNLSNTTAGIELCETNNTSISRCTIENCTYGIGLWWASNNSITRCSTSAGNIILYSSSNNIVSGNTIAKCNWHPLQLEYSNRNVLFHNNFMNNDKPPLVFMDSLNNTLDDGYPSGGSFYSDYSGTDLYQGSDQNTAGSDAIGDLPYQSTSDGGWGWFDNYPLMGPFSDFDATSEYRVQTVCNSSISDFQCNGTAIRFNVSGENDTAGFCRICIPTALLNASYKVLLNGTEIPYTLLLCSNSTHSYLYFNYPHSTEEVIITPEFPPFLILPLFTIATLLAVIVYRKKHAKILGSP